MYRIRDWNSHFENNRTRELKELRFVIIPNKQDGDGYTELLDHPNGPAHYAAWIAILQVASKGSHPAGGCGIPAGCCECRGTLLREGARWHDPGSLARLTRIPQTVFQEALPRLVAIGWLDMEVSPNQELNQQIALIPQQVAKIPQGGAEKCEISATLTRARGTEQNGIERKTYVEQARLVFAFWQEHLNHPRSVLDEKRLKAITARLKAGYSTQDLIEAVKGCKNTPHNMGHNDRSQVFDDIELICRDAQHVERFMAAANGNNSLRSLTVREKLEAERIH